MINLLKTKLAKWKEDRFLKKHGCRTRKEYDRMYDPDYCIRALEMANYYHGYKHVHCFENHKGFAYQTIYDFGPGGYRTGFNVICDWCEENLTNKWRYDCHRVIKAPSTANKWSINEIGGGDHYFFAFMDDEDYFMFKLQWGS